ncbi:6-phosphofructokinase [Moorella sulfitireducens (nom. illeg.)]|uniref:6-phosphofructokinase n=1 Tax=Neomoorella sulfitireducens TaxID=2972948 RepID=UPI0021AC8D01|nr:6-phosphofructokinase [Moorella sulfitireducens]
MKALKGNAIVGQSGGPTAVINSSLYGVIQEAKKHSAIRNLYGAIYGIEGVLKEELVDLSAEDRETIEGLKKTPGAALGGCRYMIKSDDPKDRDIKRVFEVFRKYGIRYFFYNGGNDSMDTALKIYNAARKIGYDLHVIGIPKTIDNDLEGTDHCPGYGSCAKYIITCVMEAGIHTESMYTSEPVTILVTVGRNAGWIAAASTLARKREGDAPHIICFPEIPFEKEKFLADVEREYKKYGGVFIVTGEGLRDKEGNYIHAATGDMNIDAFGHPVLGGIAETLKQLIEENLKLKTRWIKPDICQQAAMHMAAKTDVMEAEMVGRAAVRFAVEGKSGFMVTLVREPGTTYKCTPGIIELDRVANVDRYVPKEFISEDGIWTTPAFVDYCMPLIQGDVSIPMKDGLPNYSRLKKIIVKER